MVGIKRLAEAVLNVLQQMRLVVFDRQHVVTPVGVDLLGKLLLAADGIDAHQRPVQVQQLQKLGNGRDFVRALFDRYLAKRQVVLGGLGTDQLQGTQLVRARTAQGLAIDGNLLDAEPLHQGQHPLAEASLKGHGIQARKDALKGIMRRDAVGEAKKSLEPGAAAEGSDVGPAVAAGDDGTEGDGDNFEEAMESAMAARIAEFGEVGFDGQGRTGHSSPP
jgi:hypothetical protein